MENTKAKQIVVDMINFVFVSEGFPMPILFPEIMERLQNYSLKEMVEASEIVKKRMLNLDDRLIAGIYVLINYDSLPADDCRPILSDHEKKLYIVH